MDKGDNQDEPSTISSGLISFGSSSYRDNDTTIRDGLEYGGEGEGEYYEGEGYYYEDDEESPSEATGAIKTKGQQTIEEVTSSIFTEIASLQKLTEDLGPRYTVQYSSPGVARLNLSPLTQKICGCTIDDNVTTEYPWVYVKKEVIMDNLDLHSESSDFLPVKEEIEHYPGQQMLIGYAPSHVHEGQFYMCVTEEGYNTVSHSIEQLRQEQESRVRNAIYRVPRPWESQGSEEAVEETRVQETRPLYEVEVEKSGAQLRYPLKLDKRMAEMQRDGYVALVSDEHEKFNIVDKSEIDAEVTVKPELNDTTVQTATGLQVNAWSQCLLDQEPMMEIPKVKKKDLENFFKSKIDEVTKLIEDNETWDVYANDYKKLVVGCEDSLSLKITEYTEDQSFYEGNVCQGVISDLSWHPTISGVVACAYNDISRGEYRPFPRKPQIEQIDSVVLLWSLDDCLKPKLILESRRRVVTVSFCPWDGNMLVGGCCNGQVVIWDLKNKLEEIETVVPRTAAQVHYETIINNMTTWMKRDRTRDVKRPTAMSDLKQSQEDAILKIEWVPAHWSIDNRGKMTDLPADIDPAFYSKQIITASLDGTIAFWDLKWRPAVKEEESEESKKKKKKNQPAELPKALKDRISPFKVLDYTFRPTYLLVCEMEDLRRNSTVTSLSVRQPILHYQPIPAPAYIQEQQSKSTKKGGLANRQYFKITVEKDTVPFDGLFVTTMYAETGWITWEGYQFSTGVDINKETVKWSWRTSAIHDGPINNAIRARHLRDVVLTTGGRIFAVWREDYSEPIFWRKGASRYTASDWHSAKPNIILLGRNDGSIEMWDLFIKDHEPTIVQSISGKIIAGIYTHKLPTEPQCVAFCDFNGALRMFMTPKNLTEFKKSDVAWMRNFIDREVVRLKDFNEWRAKMAEERARMEAASKKDDDQKKTNLFDLPTQANEVVKHKKVKSQKERLAEIQRKWVDRELDRMQSVILAKKGLKGEELKKQREPIIKMKKEAREKELKKQRLLGQTEEFFEEEVNLNFPQLAEAVIHKEKKEGEAAAEEEPPEIKRLTKEKIGSMDEVPEIPKELWDSFPYLKKTDEEIYEEYKELEAELLKKMKEEPYDVKFDWRKMMTEGRKRRESLDINLTFNLPKKKDKDHHRQQQCKPKHKDSEKKTEARLDTTLSIDDIPE